MKIANTISSLLLVSTIFSVVNSKRVTFTLGRRQEKCFKDDFSKDQVRTYLYISNQYGQYLQILDMFFELFENFDDNLLSPRGQEQKEGVLITVYDPNGIDIEHIMISKETHKSYQKVISKSGTHKVCLHATEKLFNVNPEVKYEMAIQIENLHEHLPKNHTEKPEDEEPNRLIMKEHIDKVD